MSHFRFLDLIPELRNLVYEDVITHNRASGQTATVALLRTCRRIHNEAKSVFYAMSTLHIYPICCSPTYHDTPEIAVNGDLTGFVDSTASPTGLYGVFSHSLSIPAKVVVELRVEKDGPKPFSALLKASMRLTVHRLLHAIVHWLNLDGRAHHLHFTLVNGEVYMGRMELFKEDFAPLAELFCRNSLSINGLDDVVVKHLCKRREERLSPSIVEVPRKVPIPIDRLELRRIVFGYMDQVGGYLYPRRRER